ncbi:MAG: FHA domain-containing protein [Pirellulales bacterium]
MSATIRVDTGISAGSRFWVDRPVLRIGSDPQCDICLPSAELAPHALTLEFRDGNYRVYNRSASRVYVGSAIVESGTSAIWRDGETIQLPGELRVALEIDGDPRPATRPEGSREDGLAAAGLPLAAAEASAEAAAAAPAKSSSKSWMQLAVIGVCVLALVGLLTMKQGGGEKAAAAGRPTFNELVDDSQKKDATHQAIIRRLQYAQAAVVRYGTKGNKVARERFSKLRDDLVSHVDAVEGDEKADVERILSYVEYQLGRL